MTGEWNSQRRLTLPGTQQQVQEPSVRPVQNPRTVILGVVLALKSVQLTCLGLLQPRQSCPILDYRSIKVYFSRGVGCVILDNSLASFSVSVCSKSGAQCSATFVTSASQFCLQLSWASSIGRNAQHIFHTLMSVVTLWRNRGSIHVSRVQRSAYSLRAIERRGHTVLE